MRQNPRSKNILDALSKIPCILNIRWAGDYKVFVDVIEETTEREKESIKSFLLLLCDKYEVVFQIRKRKKWWQKVLENLRWGGKK